MNAWFLLLPLVSAFTGWVISLVLIRLLFYRAVPGKRPGMNPAGMLTGHPSPINKKVEALIRESLISSGEMQQLTVSPAMFQKILPTIETHIDHFLKVTLKEKMPMVGSLIGERTTTQMKNIFMDELETLFPVIIKDYTSHMFSDPEFTGKIMEKINAIPVSDMKRIVHRVFAKELRNIQVIGVIAGFIIGVIQLLTSLIFYR